MNTITLTETLVSGRTLVKYDIANAPVKEFRVRVPAAFKNVEVTGAQIRRRDETNGEWRVELQSKVRGEYLLTVTWELPRGAARPTWSSWRASRRWASSARPVMSLSLPGPRCR